MEASALHAPRLARRSLPGPLLRLRSDEQLVALFRTGSDEAFAVLHDRYRQRLFAYVRQMLSVSTRADAEDVLQDVFVRAYGALRADERELNVRAWLYRVAHNRCVDRLRRPTPPPSDVFDVSRSPLQDPLESAQRREDLRRLVRDVGRLPDQQRSALLMREINGLAYADIATALDVTVPAVKSLLVRARVGLVEANQARDTDCSLIRGDLLGCYDRGVKASARARRHLRECKGCREYRVALKGMRRSFAALTPAAGLGPLALVAKAAGLGGASGGAAAGGSAAVGGAGVATTGAVACKVAAVVCTAAIATGAGVEAKHLSHSYAGTGGHRAAVAQPATAPAAPAPVSASTGGANSPAPVSAGVVHRSAAVPSAATPTAAERRVADRRRAGRAASPADDEFSAPTASMGPEPAVVAPVTDAPATPKDAGGTTLPDGEAGPPQLQPAGATAAQPTTHRAATTGGVQPVTATPPAPAATPIPPASSAPVPAPATP